MKKNATPHLCDTHCHLTATEIPGGPKAAFERASRAGVTRIAVVESVPESWKETTELCRDTNGGLLPACGLHPCFLPDDGECDRLLSELVELSPLLSAIGETGLDGTAPGMDRQKRVLREHLRLACDLDKPVLIHCRRAFPEFLEILSDFAPALRGVMHCYSGSAEQLAPFLKAGLFISFAGPITFEGARRPLKALKATPLDRLLLETDSPDLTPVPYRGLPNEPAFLPCIAAVAADAHGLPLVEICRITYDNAARLFRF